MNLFTYPIGVNGDFVGLCRDIHDAVGGILLKFEVGVNSTDADLLQLS